MDNSRVTIIETEFETVLVTEEEIAHVIEFPQVGPPGPPGPSGIPDAPNDGKLYGRKNGEWVEINE